MKKRVRLFSLIMIVIICLSFSSIAAELRASLYISRTAGYAVENDDGIEFGFTILGTGRMTNIGATKIEVKNSSGRIVATYRYTDDGYSDMMGHDRTTYSSSIIYEDGTPGNEYCAVIYFKAQNSSGSDTDTLTTGWATA